MSFAWALSNTLWVFAVLNGDRVHRVESAVTAFALTAALYLIFAPRTAPTQGGDQSPQWRLPFVYTLLAWSIAAASQLQYPFLSDDYVFLASSESGSQSWEFYRPLFVGVFHLLDRASGGTPALFHLVSFVLHGACALLTVVIVTRLSGSKQLASLIGALVVLNPLQLEATLWVSGLQELMWSFFALTAVAVYSSTARQNWRHTAVVVTAALSAVLSKETGVTVVLLLAAVDWWQQRRPRYLIYSIIIAGLAVYFAFRASSGVPGPQSSFVIRSGYELKEFLVMPYRRFLVPVSAASWPMPSWLIGLIGSAVLSGTAWTVWTRRADLLIAGVVVVLVTTVPLQRVLFVSPLLEHARYLYLPWLGWSMVLAGIAAGLLGRRGVLVCSWALVALMGSALIANFQPWSEARQFITALTERITRGAEPRAAVDEWRRVHGWPAVVEPTLPSTHEGVWLFLNGSEDYLRLLRARRLPPEDDGR